MLCYSSLAVVLLVATLAGSQRAAGCTSRSRWCWAPISAAASSAMLTTLAVRRRSARRVPLGNFLFKAGRRACSRWPLLPFASPWLKQLEHEPAAISWSRSTSASTSRWRCSSSSSPAASRDLAERLAARTAAPARTARSRVISTRSALGTPALALGNAAREAIALGDTVEDMLAGLLTVLRTNDAQLAEASAPTRRRDRPSCTPRSSSI